MDIDQRVFEEFMETGESSCQISFTFFQSLLAKFQFGLQRQSDTIKLFLLFRESLLFAGQCLSQGIDFSVKIAPAEATAR